MSEHLSPATLNSLVDGELSAEQRLQGQQHLAGCLPCSTSALELSLLKSASAKAGMRYTPPPELRERLEQLASHQGFSPKPLHSPPARIAGRTKWPWGRLGWAAAAALLLVFLSVGLIQQTLQRSQVAAARQTASVTEICDQHIATLAAASPQVVSSDRHTVKPWFQGKLPFSFNLPDDLPNDTRLDGANLTYLHNQPAAQLLYSIGGHRVSVFVSPAGAVPRLSKPLAEHAGFHLREFRTNDLEAVAVSDVDPARLASLLQLVEKAQTR